MESKLNQNIQKMMTHVGATGVSVADENGLQIISKGNLDPRIAATSTQIINDARNMNVFSKNENPMVVVHTTNNTKLTIVNNHGETVTLVSK